MKIRLIALVADFPSSLCYFREIERLLCEALSHTFTKLSIFILIMRAATIPNLTMNN